MTLEIPIPDWPPEAWFAAGLAAWYLFAILFIRVAVEGPTGGSFGEESFYRILFWITSPVFLPVYLLAWALTPAFEYPEEDGEE